MAKTTPTYGYNSKGESKLFELEKDEKLPSGWSDAPKGDLKDGAVTPPDSTSLRPVPAPERYDSELVADPSINLNGGPANYTPTGLPHIPGDTDIHGDDENHDGIDERLPRSATYNKPVVPREVNGAKLADIEAAQEVDENGRLVGEAADKAKNKAQTAKKG